MSSSKPILVPQVNANDEVVVLVRWLADPGVWVEAGGSVAEIETTKAVVEIETEESGYLAPCVDAGAQIAVGEPLAWIQASYDPENIPRPQVHETPLGAGRIVSRDAASLLAQHGLKAEDIPGKGPIRRTDVEMAVGGDSAAATKDWDEFIDRLPDDPQTIVVFGSDLQGMVVLDCIEAASPGRPVVFVDDDPKQHELLGRPVVPAALLTKLNNKGFTSAHVAISSPKAKLACAERLIEANFEIEQVRHPGALVSPFAHVAEGCFFGPLTLVGPEAKIGAHAQINNGASVAHHAHVGKAARLSDGVRLAGHVKVGVGAFIGLGVTINEKITIGDYVTIVSGVSIFNDVPDEVTVKVDGKHYPNR